LDRKFIANFVIDLQDFLRILSFSPEEASLAYLFIEAEVHGSVLSRYWMCDNYNLLSEHGIRYGMRNEQWMVETIRREVNMLGGLRQRYSCTVEFSVLYRAPFSGNREAL